MNKEYIPVMVTRNGKREIWTMDITNLGVTELIQLKERLINTPYPQTIQLLDSIIKRDIETIVPTHNIKNSSYVRTYKKNKKEEKMKKRKIKKKGNR